MTDVVVQSDLFSGVVSGFLLFLVYLIAGLLPACGVIYVVYFLLTLPMRRNERARFCLDLLERGLKNGRAPEATVAEAGATRDRALGVRFHLLAAYLEQGFRFGEALDRVPRLLPLQIRSVLRVGERIGDVGRVLPACRRLLHDPVSQVRAANNYVILLAFAFTPAILFIPMVFRVKVLPAYEQVFVGMSEGMPLPAFTRLVFGGSLYITGVELALLLVLWFATLTYLGGPRLHAWLDRGLPGAGDWLLARLPWRRKRLQRDFSSMLAALLDSEVPEIEAVRLAGNSTANAVFRRGAARICAALEKGAKLPEAIHLIDDSGELRWRLSNALRVRGGFLQALTGWLEALDAKAFQQEQAAAQLATTGLVLFNGLIVAGFVIAVFLVLIQILNEAILW